MADTCYLEITDDHEPIEIDIDVGEDRTMWSLNFSAMTDGVVTEFVEDLVRLCQIAGIALVENVDTIYGRKKAWPSGAGPFHRFIPTSGPFAMLTHNGDSQERPSAQVVVIGRDYDAARARALAIWRTLRVVRNTTVTSP